MRVMIFENKSMVLFVDSMYDWKWNGNKDDIRSLVMTFIKFGRDFDKENISRVIFNPIKEDKFENKFAKVRYSPRTLHKETKIEDNIEMLVKIYDDYCVIIFVHSISKYYKSSKDDYNNIFDVIYKKFTDEYKTIDEKIMENMDYISHCESTKSDQLCVQKCEEVINKYISFSNNLVSIINSIV